MSSASQSIAFEDVVVAVATFRRNDDLSRLLESLSKQTCRGFTVLVVDNDPDGSARQLVLGADRGAAASMEYVHEKMPGIAAARNRCLAEHVRFKMMLIIDDDETAESTWVSDMATALTMTGATAVHGSVSYIYPPGTPRWIMDGGYFVNLSLPGGTQLDFAATNNLGLNLDQWRELGEPEFDNALGLTGGSDLMFTRRLTAEGGTIIWRPEIRVFERVPSQRAKREWVIRRAVRSGESQAGAMLPELQPWSLGWLRLIAYGASRLVGGGLFVLYSAIRLRPGGIGQGIRHMLRGWGIFRAVAGKRIQEYARS